MSDSSMNNQPSGSTPADSEGWAQPYTYKKLSNELGYPKAPLAGAQYNNAPGTAVQRAGRKAQAEQDAGAAKDAAARRADKARVNSAATSLQAPVPGATTRPATKTAKSSKKKG